MVVVVVLVVAGLAVVAERLQRRRSRTDDPNAGAPRAGVFGLGEAPAKVHHRMGSAGQPPSRRG
ncbi:hypothetical protein C7S10_15305 [Nocardioides currus]|uniref:Uncharacterized protein n=1 Tax=Nocardioides currus TaxID=2133958 RepID=A0A2R7YU53_9ACTN|nr:hypothetical protein C7S10_15305 [Nocardioides currus]